ncbi:MAG TPA: lysoplasmalogenase [Dermatophilaceae bacterium]|nr:lysoplasmalogenase [Dermatophilaceae bacterium]
MTAAAAVAFALIVAVDWVAVYRQWARAEQVAKPLVMVALAWLAFSMGAAHDEVGRLVLVALGFSLAGDIFLLRESAAAFFGGLVSFLLAHITYVLAFLTVGFQKGWALVGLLIAVSLSLTAGRRIVKGAADQGGAALGAGVTAYLVVISAMVVAAGGTARPPVLLGAVSFLVSDTVLALDRFVGQRDHARMVVIVTYHLGQVMMVIGTLR